MYSVEFSLKNLAASLMAMAKSSSNLGQNPVREVSYYNESGKEKGRQPRRPHGIIRTSACIDSIFAPRGTIFCPMCAVLAKYSIRHAARNKLPRSREPTWKRRLKLRQTASAFDFPLFFINRKGSARFSNLAMWLLVAVTITNRAA
jgi:hypothetical protein